MCSRLVGKPCSVFSAEGTSGGAPEGPTTGLKLKRWGFCLRLASKHTGTAGLSLLAQEQKISQSHYFIIHPSSCWEQPQKPFGFGPPL